MKLWIEIWHTHKKTQRKLYENGAGEKIVGHSRLKLKQFSEDIVNDLYCSIHLAIVVSWEMAWTTPPALVKHFTVILSREDCNCCIPSSSLFHRHSGKDHLVEVGTPQRIFYIQADNDYEMDEWLKAFQTVISSLRISGSVVSCIVTIVIVSFSHCTYLR